MQGARRQAEVIAIGRILAADRRAACAASTRWLFPLPPAGRRGLACALPIHPPRGDPRHEHAHQVPARREQDAQALVQHRRRPAGAAGAGAAPGHDAAGGPGRPGAAVPDGADPAGGVHRARDPDSRAGARGLQAVAAVRRWSARTGWRRRSARRRRSTTSTKACRPPAATSPTPPCRRPGTTPRPASRSSATETGAGQWGSSLAFAGSLFGSAGAGVPGARVLRPEALPPRADGNLRRHLRRQPVATRPTPAAPSWRSDPTTRARWASPSARRWRSRRRTTTPSTRSARC